MKKLLEEQNPFANKVQVERTVLDADDVLGYIAGTENPTAAEMMEYLGATDRERLIMFLADLELTGLMKFTLTKAGELQDIRLTERGKDFLKRE